jgi:hypothetical protein
MKKLMEKLIKEGEGMTPLPLSLFWTFGGKRFG